MSNLIKSAALVATISATFGGFTSLAHSAPNTAEKIVPIIVADIGDSGVGHEDGIGHVTRTNLGQAAAPASSTSIVTDAGNPQAKPAALADSFYDDDNCSYDDTNDGGSQ